MAASAPACTNACCCARSARYGSAMTTRPGSTAIMRAPSVAMNACRAKLARTRDSQAGSAGTGAPADAPGDSARAMPHLGVEELVHLRGRRADIAVHPPLEERQRRAGQRVGQRGPPCGRDAARLRQLGEAALDGARDLAARELEEVVVAAARQEGRAQRRLA